MTRFQPLPALAATLFAATFGASAETPVSDETCRDLSGRRINTAECIAFFKTSQPLSDMECAASPECRAQAEARAQAFRERQLKERSDRQASIERQAQADEDRSAAAAAKKKAACGDDYLAPKIGMSIDRAKQCVSPSLRVFGQVNRADGVVTIYRTGSGATFHAMDGVIVAWNR